MTGDELIVVSGRVPIRPEGAEQFAAAAADMTRAARQDPDCLVYVMTLDQLEPGTVTIFEIWRDVASLSRTRSRTTPASTRGAPRTCAPAPRPSPW